MLLSLMCADECSVLWPYLLESGDTDGIDAPENLETIRAEFAAVVEERRRHELCRPVLVADVSALQRETSNQIASSNGIVSNQIAVLNDIVSGQSNQIADLQRSTGMIVEQNQQMQEQIRQMHAMLMSFSREQEQPADVDERDKRAAKRRCTGR
jgi:hypothetical protein